MIGILRAYNVMNMSSLCLYDLAIIDIYNLYKQNLIIWMPIISITIAMAIYIKKY